MLTTDIHLVVLRVPHECDFFKGPNGHVFGDKKIPSSLDWRSRAPFGNTSILIEELLRRGMHDQVILAAERCFDYVENLAGVHLPDDFLECYSPIIRSWILALHASGLPVSNMSDQVRYLEDSDRYGAFYDLRTRFAEELGEQVLAHFAKKDRHSGK